MTRRTPTAHDIARFHNACTHGHLWVARAFLDDFGAAHVNALCRHHQPPDATPLVRALWSRNADIAILLIRNGADLAIDKPPSARLPMKIAIENGMTAVVEAMLDNGWPADHLTMFGQSGLARATCENMRPIIELFLARGANVDLADEDGNTPLMNAVRRKNAVMVRRLLAAGADTAATNSKRQTAMGIAMEKDYTDIAILLRDARQYREDVIAEKKMQEDICQRRARINAVKPPRLKR